MVQGRGCFTWVCLISGSHANSFSSSTSVTVLAFDVLDSVDLPLTTSSNLPFFGALDYAEITTRDYLSEEEEEKASKSYTHLIEPVINGISTLGYIVAGIVVLLMGILVASRIAKQRKLQRSKKVLEIHSNEHTAHAPLSASVMVDDTESPNKKDDWTESQVSNQGKGTIRIVKKSSKVIERGSVEISEKVYEKLRGFLD
jgi:hypothetical protein